MGCSYYGVGLLWALILLLIVGFGRALRFDVTGQAPKCLSENIHSNVLVLANYSVVAHESEHHTVSVKVISPYGTTVHEAEGVEKGKFSLTTAESGNYVACFWLPPTEKNLILHMQLDWKMGVSAKDWESVVKKEKIEGVGLELMKLQYSVEEIHQTLLYIREREREMRNVSEVTNTRVAWLGITALLICLAVSGWQLWHLKSFFERKKLL